jgi:hypothetical protein
MTPRSRSPGYADMPALAYCAALIGLRMRAYARAAARALAHALATLALEARPRRTPSLRRPLRGR